MRNTILEILVENVMKKDAVQERNNIYKAMF